MEHFYHGKPCKRCGGTARDLKGCQCLHCKNKPTGKPRTPAETYESKPCKVCGATTRYKKGRACKPCKLAKSLTEQKTRRESIPNRERGVERCQGCGWMPNYFFYDFCRKCQAKQKKGSFNSDRENWLQCGNCGIWKNYIFKDYCKACQALEKRRREYWQEWDRLEYLENPF